MSEDAREFLASRCDKDYPDIAAQVRAGDGTWIPSYIALDAIRDSRLKPGGARPGRARSQSDESAVAQPIAQAPIRNVPIDNRYSPTKNDS